MHSSEDCVNVGGHRHGRRSRRAATQQDSVLDATPRDASLPVFIGGVLEGRSLLVASECELPGTTSCVLVLVYCS